MLRTLVPVAMLASGAFAQSFMINTPNSPVQCEPDLLTWQGGNAPYFLTVNPGGQPSAPALETIQNNITGTSITWNVNLASGTSCFLQIRDSTGASVQSGTFMIQPSSDSSCVGSSSGVASQGSSSQTATAPAGSPSGTTTGAGATTGGASTTGGSSSSKAATTGGASTTGGSGTSSGSPSTSSTPSSAGPAYVAQLAGSAVVAAALGLILV